MSIRIFGMALAAVLALPASAATFDVSNPTEFQNALTAAQSNGEGDTINVEPGTYDIGSSGTLTYLADPSENYALSILGADSDLVTLNGGMAGPILRVDTTPVSLGDAVMVTVTNMTFVNGNAVGTPSDGGALLIDVVEAVSIEVRGSEFYDNAADDDGGAIFIQGNALEGIFLDDLTVDGNEARGIAGDGTGDGGGVHVGAGLGTNIWVQDIDFFDNLADGFGGGLEVQGPSDASATASVTVFDVDFSGNQITGTGSGGGLSAFAIDVIIDTTGFFENTATERGGGFHLREYSRNRVINSGFIDNSAPLGGGMASDTAASSGIVLENTTFTGNTATTEGGGMYLVRNLPTPQINLYNNIVWGNNAPSGADIFIDDDPNDSGGAEVTTVELYYNDFSDYTTTCTLNPSCTPRLNESDNIDADPLLTANGNLMQGSPCIDTGLNSGHPSYPAIVVDFEGDTRPFDGDGDTVATIDMGADEYIGAVAQAADLAVSKSDDPDPVTGGNNVTYTVVVTNNGPGEATSVMLTDTLDGTVTFVSVDQTQGSCSETSGVVSCPLGTLANGASATVTIVVQTPSVVDPATISNTAEVMATETDPVMSDNTAVEDTTVVPPGPAMADLAITKVDTPDPVISGGPQLTYDITITNNGPDSATGVTMTDTLPAGVVFDDASSTVGTCTESSGTVTCDIGDLALDATATVTITVTPDAVSVATDIVNTATVAGNEVDPNAANDSASETTTVNPPQSDMMVTVTATPASPSIGETVTFDLTVSNGGPSNNLGVSMTITLPVAGTIETITISQGTCGTPVDGMVDCTIGDMLADASVTAQVVVTAPDVATSLVLQASVSGSVADSASANNTASDSVTVVEAIDLIIEGVSKGAGAIGWLGLLLAAAAVVALRARRTLRVMLPCLAVAMLMLVPAGQAVAQGDWYVHAAIGQADLDYSAADLTSDLSSLGWTISNPLVDSSETAWKVLGGFAFNEYIAIEGGYVSLGEVLTRFGATVAPTEIDAILSDTLSVHPYQGDGWVAAAVVTWPVNEDRFAVTGRAGVFRWESETDVRVIQGGSGSVAGKDSGTDAMYGVGIEWQLNETWSLTAEWERYRLNEWLDVPSIGVKVYF